MTLETIQEKLNRLKEKGPTDPSGWGQLLDIAEFLQGELFYANHPDRRPTPPKKIEFEVTCDETGYPLIFTNAILKGLYGDADPLERAGRVLRVTVEEKR